MIVHRILIDDLPFVSAIPGRPKVEFYKDAAQMILKMTEIKTKKPHWYVSCEQIHIPDESSPAKQVIKEHEILHNKHVSWKKCSDNRCVRLQVAMQNRG